MFERMTFVLCVLHIKFFPNLYRILAEDPSHHVDVVYHAIVEYATGVGQIIYSRQRRISSGNSDSVNMTDFALANSLPNGAVTRIEAPIKRGEQNFSNFSCGIVTL